MTTKQTFKSEHPKGDCPGYYTGEGDEKSGVVVIQELWGVNDQIKEKATDWFNSQGFATIVPDLYRGKVAKDHEEAGHYMGDLDWPGAVQDIRGAAKFLKDKGAQKVGVVGFCMGGALSLASSVLINEVDAASVFCGIPDPKLADPKNVKVPLQLHFGKKDDLAGFSNPEAVDNLEQRLKDAGVPYTPFRDYDAGHAFCYSTGDNYHEESAKKAQGRVLEFFKQHL